MTASDPSLPLLGARVDSNFSGLLGLTDVAGWLNISESGLPPGPDQLTATLTGYSTNATIVDIVPSTDVFASIVLLAEGPFDVQVLEAGSGFPVYDADGVVVPGVIEPGVGPQSFATGVHGWANLTLPPGNYTVAAWRTGFDSNDSPVVHPHRWVYPTIVVVELAYRGGTNVSVLVLSETTKAPIVGAEVTVGTRLAGTTDAVGRTFFSSVRPPGKYVVSASAPNYLPNASIVWVTYLAPDVDVTLYLTPAPFVPCSTCLSSGAHRGTPNLPLLPSGGVTLTLLLLSPAAVLLAGGVYLAAAGRGRRAGPVVRR